jgi:kynurenine formamidase
MPRFIDLSHPLADGLPNFPNDPQLSVKVHTTVAQSGYNLSHLSLSSHQGTHLDAPFHFYDDGATLDQIPLARFCGPATLVDLAPGGALAASTPLTVDTFAPHAAAFTPGARVLYRTGWDREGYEILAQRPDVAILELGNPDVTDETLDLLVGLPKLRELTLNDSGVTDAGLATLARLPALQTLRIARTKITPEGLRRFLDAPPRRLSQLDVSGNGIPATILRQWKNAAGGVGERRYVN